MILGFPLIFSTPANLAVLLFASPVEDMADTGDNVKIGLQVHIQRRSKTRLCAQHVQQAQR